MISLFSASYRTDGCGPLIVRVGNRSHKALAILNKSTSRCIYIRIQSLLVKVLSIESGHSSPIKFIVLVYLLLHQVTPIQSTTCPNLVSFTSQK